MKQIGDDETVNQDKIFKRLYMSNKWFSDKADILLTFQEIFCAKHFEIVILDFFKRLHVQFYTFK